ncbi:MAG: STAS domain-containing protein [Acidimicrobiales bacterium]
MTVGQENLVSTISTGRDTSEHLALTVDLDRSSAVIALIGEVDHHTKEYLRRILRGVLAVGAVSVELDCEALAFIDASGITCIAEAAGHLDERGGSLTLHHPSPLLERMLAVTQIDQRVTIA